MHVSIYRFVHPLISFYANSINFYLLTYPILCFLGFPNVNLQLGHLQFILDVVTGFQHPLNLRNHNYHFKMNIIRLSNSVL